MEDLAHWRMRNQRLWGYSFESAVDVVLWLGAVQSQEFQYAKWSVGQRTAGLTDSMVQRAFAAGEILRTHVLRPTWHFVLPEDIRWMLELTAPRIKARMALGDRRLGLDDGMFHRANRVLASALEGGAHRTRRELSEALARAGIAATGQRLGHILMHAELDGVVCSGAPKGKQHTYALLDDRARKARTLDRDHALAELARRFFFSRGPATIRDLAWWAGLTAAEARLGLEAIASVLEPEVVDGRTYWFDPATRGRRRQASPTIDLVQCFDEVVISYGESRDVVTGPELARGFPGRAAPFMHAVLVDGRFVGSWRHMMTKGTVIVQTHLLRPLEPDESKSLEAAVERYGRFLELPAQLSISHA